MIEKQWSAAELAERSQERLKVRNLKIAELRDRAGLSMDELAKLMGFKGQSSIQRYLSADYDKGFRPELAAKFKAALVGRGNPPIQPVELNVFNNWSEAKGGSTVDIAQMMYEHLESGKTREEYHQKLDELGLREDNFSKIASLLARMRNMRSLNHYEGSTIVGLPLAEGHVALMMPSHLSDESAETLRNWIEHLITLANKNPDQK